MAGQNQHRDGLYVSRLEQREIEWPSRDERLPYCVKSGLRKNRAIEPSGQ